MILDFGPRKVLVETKFPRIANNVSNRIRDAVDQVDALRKAANIGQACVIAFMRKSPEGVSETVERHKGGEILSIVIEVR